MTVFDYDIWDQKNIDSFFSENLFLRRDHYRKIEYECYAAVDSFSVLSDFLYFPFEHLCEAFHMRSTQNELPFSSTDSINFD